MWANCLPTGSEFDGMDFKDFTNNSYDLLSSPSPVPDISASDAEDLFDTAPIDWEMFAANNAALDPAALYTTSPLSSHSPVLPELSSPSSSTSSDSPRDSTYSESKHHPATRKASKTQRATKASSPKPPCSRKTHNLIEKKYRTNLNTKINALRASLPSLCMPSSNSSEEDEERPVKWNKGIILEKAISYIAELEACNKRQEVEMKELRRIAYETRSSYQAFSELRRKMGGTRAIC